MKPSILCIIMTFITAMDSKTIDIGQDVNMVNNSTWTLINATNTEDAEKHEVKQILTSLQSTSAPIYISTIMIIIYCVCKLGAIIMRICKR